MSKEGFHCICLSIMIDSVLKGGKNYYLQVFKKDKKIH